MAQLMNYETGDYIREATQEETERSLEAAKVDGGVGAMAAVVGDKVITCYVVGEETEGDEDED